MFTLKNFCNFFLTTLRHFKRHWTRTTQRARKIESIENRCGERGLISEESAQATTRRAKLSGRTRRNCRFSRRAAARRSSAHVCRARAGLRCKAGEFRHRRNAPRLHAAIRIGEEILLSRTDPLLFLRSRDAAITPFPRIRANNMERSPRPDHVESF